MECSAAIKKNALLVPGIHSGSSPEQVMNAKQERPLGLINSDFCLDRPKVGSFRPDLIIPSHSQAKFQVLWELV